LTKSTKSFHSARRSNRSAGRSQVAEILWFSQECCYISTICRFFAEAKPEPAGSLEHVAIESYLPQPLLSS
jgi:hypothetical protein